MRDQPFSSSFFNLFNYDFGLLNIHKDRYLITCIYPSRFEQLSSIETETDAGLNRKRRSSMWIRNKIGEWCNADNLTKSDECIVMIGEDMEAILNEGVSE